MMVYFIYILSNYKRNVLYTGVTNNLVNRVYQHKNNLVKGFTQKYAVHDLLYYETFITPLAAIEREKQIKNWHKDWKLNLIRRLNPELKDLYSTILE
jgi:putative endonuclease